MRGKDESRMYINVRKRKMRSKEGKRKRGYVKKGRKMREKKTKQGSRGGVRWKREQVRRGQQQHKIRLDTERECNR